MARVKSNKSNGNVDEEGTNKAMAMAAREGYGRKRDGNGD